MPYHPNFHLSEVLELPEQRFDVDFFLMTRTVGSLCTLGRNQNILCQVLYICMS